MLDELSVGRQPRVDARARHVVLAELRACRGGQRQPVAGLPSQDCPPRHRTAASGQGGAGPQGAGPGDSRGTAAAAERVAGLRRTPAVRG